MEQSAHADSHGDRSQGRTTPINITIEEQPAQEAEQRSASQQESVVGDPAAEAKETEGSQVPQQQRDEAPEAQNSRHEEDSKIDGSQRQPSSATYARQSDWTAGARDYQRSGSGFARQYDSNKYRQSVSPHLQTEYERTQRVLEQARARSREQVYMNPTSANGYEKRNGSPQRYSPKREAVDVNRVSYRPSTYSHVPQSATYAAPVPPRRSSHSPVPDQQAATPQSTNFRSSTIRQQEELYRTVNDAQRSASRDASSRPLLTGKENLNPGTTMQPPAPPTQQKSLSGSQSQASRVIEHSQTVVTNVAAIKSGEGIFDQIIATCRRQLATNANFESDFDALRLKIQEVMQRRNLLEDSIRHLSQDYERQLEMQEKESAVLKKELEALKVQNADLGSEGNHINSDIMDAKTILNQKETELSRTKHDVARQQDESRFLRDTLDDTKRQLTAAYATKDTQHAKIFNLTNTVKQQEASNFSATASQQQKSTQLQGTNEQIRRLQDSLHHKSIQNEDAAGKYELARAEHARCMGEAQALQKDCENANQRNGFLLETQRQLTKQKESEQGRGSDLHAEQAQKESTFVQLDNELQSLSKELDAVRRSNESLLEAGHCYKQELHALQNHADILALQNNDLQKELDEFVLTDDIIKTGLDRKTRVQAMKDRNVFQTSQSLANVEKSRSPARSASRSPLRSMTNNYAKGSGPNSLTQAYMSHNRMSQQQQSQHEGSQLNFQNHATTLQDMCRKQLQENLRQQDQRQYASTSSHQHLARSTSRKEQSQSPVDYRASNGSPLRKSKEQI